MLGQPKMVCESLRDGISSPLPLTPLGKLQPPAVTESGRVMKREICLGIGDLGCDASSSPSHSLLCTERGWRRLLGCPGLRTGCCAPTMHLAACHPVCCCPAPPLPPARPPAQNRKGKEVISIVSGSPEKLPFSEGAGGIPGAGNQIKARQEWPPPPALSCLVCVSFP